MRILNAICIATVLIPQALFAYSGGDGSAGNPYRIGTFNDFIMLVQNSSHWSQAFILTADIDLAGEDMDEAWIAWDTNPTKAGFQGPAFTGTFNGNHHVIRNMKITGVGYLGLFGQISGATIVNLTIQNATIQGGEGSAYLGILAAHNNSSTITNCSVSGTMSGCNDIHHIGGLVGDNKSGGSNPSVIMSCHARVTLTALTNSHDLGGLVGENSSSGVIESSSAVATIECGDDSYQIGGLAGFNFGTIRNSRAEEISIHVATGAYRIGGLAGGNYSAITDCTAAGTIQGDADSEILGGLVGNQYGTHAVIRNCSADCRVSGSIGSTDLGGLVGENEKPALIDNCRSAGTVTNGSILGGIVGRNGGTVHHCHSDAAVVGLSSESTFGGLAGYNNGILRTSCSFGPIQTLGSGDAGGLAGILANGGSISRCYNQADITCGEGGSRVGGLVGYITGGTISDCYSDAHLTAKYNLGGLVGYLKNAASTVSRCYAAGTIAAPSTGGMFHGGIVGVLATGTIADCFWDTEAMQVTDVAGYSSGTITNVFGKTTAEMKTRSTFTAYGWDYLGESANGTNDPWRMCVDGIKYPILTWQYVEYGDFACPNGIEMQDLNRLSEDWLSSYAISLVGADADDDQSVGVGDLLILTKWWLAGMP